jgi:hypothetical protein
MIGFCAYTSPSIIMQVRGQPTILLIWAWLRLFVAATVLLRQAFTYTGQMAKGLLSIQMGAGAHQLVLAY